MQNQNELGVDCGGPCANRCELPELTGALVSVEKPNPNATKDYGTIMIALLLALITVLTFLNKMEAKLDSYDYFQEPKGKLRLLKIIHGIVIISILILLYYLLKS
jgi:hypothetical protein